jgi:Mrp family chromosome partitioning ATPase/DUF971 family protein
MESLRNIVDPHLKKDIVSLDFVKEANVTDQGLAQILLELSPSSAPIQDQFVSLIKAQLKSVDGISDVDVKVTFKNPQSAIMPSGTGLEKVSNIVAVSSCKGGVGKSTVTVNLAYEMAKQGAKVGIFDADVYGPSLPTMTHTVGKSLEPDEDRIKPIEMGDVKLMSFGYTQNEADGEGPAILRGPMVSQIINQLLTHTNWGELDYLFIDMPPGTGDVQLTLGQLIPLTAAVIVTTPQHISFIDVVKGIEMFDTLKVPTIGVVENMSYFQVPGTEEKHYIFGKGALKKLRDQFGFQHVAVLPVVPTVAEQCDSGMPYVMNHDDTDISRTFTGLAHSVIEEIRKLEHELAPIPNVGFEKGKGILVQFDGHPMHVINAKDLRYACACAYCEEEMTGKKIIKMDEIPDSIYPFSMNPVGNYALGVNWSDNHSSLYPYEVLKEFAGIK